MRGLFFLTAVLSAASVPAVAGDGTPEKVEKLDSVVVSSSRAGRDTPVTYTMISRPELRRQNPMNSLPQALDLQPSVVTSLEGGTGLGYSKMTVRGSKGSQINVTLNGITLNDSESQEVFWVNIPALTGIISSVQLQRGLGSSISGPGAFGASINMSTASVGDRPSGTVSVAGGSYNTMTTIASAGTGLTRSGLYASAAYSKNTTDGYIRNAKADVQSAFVTIGWLHGNNSLRLTYLMGDQCTGITWNGISQAEYESDRRANGAGSYKDQYGNKLYYDNETDNYTQHNLQLNYTHGFTDNLLWSTTLNYTKGDGYYENYKSAKKFSAYGLPDYVAGDGTVYKKSDFIVRKAMDNAYYVLSSNLAYKSDALDLTGGVYLSRYDGDHPGKVMWSNVMGEGFDYGAFNGRNGWYFYNGLKQEVNAFVRAEYSPLEWLVAYADLQYRGVFLKMHGTDSDFADLGYRNSWNFLNPRAGVTFRWSPEQKAYIYAALGHREPGKSDFQDNIKSARIEGREMTLKPEQMLDIELGYSYEGEKFSGSANVYLMEYRDMLLETGRLSDSGYAVKDNIPRTWRRGIELAAACTPVEGLRLDANATLSVNKIHNYTFYCTAYDALPSEANGWDPAVTGMYSEAMGDVTMRMSPSVTGMARASWSPFVQVARNSLKTTTFSLTGKYVGSQYWDNTENSARRIPGYFVAGLMVSHDFDIASGKLGLKGYVNNLLNNKYYSDVFEELGCYGPEQTVRCAWESLFPQAAVNFMFGVTYSF